MHGSTSGSVVNGSQYTVFLTNGYFTHACVMASGSLTLQGEFVII